MNDAPIHIAVAIATYNSGDDIADCLHAIFASDEGNLVVRVFVLDHHSTDNTIEIIESRFPQVALTKSIENRGFAGGHDMLWQLILASDFDAKYLAVLNPDTIVHSGWISALCDHLEAHDEVAIAQPKILLHGEPDDPPRINTVGNRSHYLGFGFVTGFNETDEGQYDVVHSIDFASGAAMVLKTEAIRAYGLFDERFFMYLEDADVSWRMRIVGREVVCVPQSVVEHKHDPAKTLGFYFHLERNRWWLIFGYYRAATIALIWPMLLLMEVGANIHGLMNGQLREKWRAYGAFLFGGRKPGGAMRHLLDRRRHLQSIRTRRDRQWMTRFAGAIDFPPVNRGVMRRLVNPVLAGYWAVAKRLIWW